MTGKRFDNEIRITPSVLDRLLDYEPELSSEPAKSRSRSLSELKQSVRRDLEWLLNTRRYAGEISDRLEETNRSLMLYGLPDFTALGAKNPHEQRRLTKELEAALKLFEPRFIDLKVTLTPPDKFERVFRFKIEARLRVEPTPEPVVFDTVLQLGSGEYSVQEK